MRNNVKLKTAVAMGIMNVLAKHGNPLQEVKDYLLSPMSQEDKYRAQGLKPFKFPGGVIVWAINAKNADKKYLKRNKSHE